MSDCSACWRSCLKSKLTFSKYRKRNEIIGNRFRKEKYRWEILIVLSFPYEFIGRSVIMYHKRYKCCTYRLAHIFRILAPFYSKVLCSDLLYFVFFFPVLCCPLDLQRLSWCFPISITHCLITDLQKGQWKIVYQNFLCAKWQAFAIGKEQLSLFFACDEVGIQFCPLGLKYDSTQILSASLQSK